ncbi:putative transposase IS891/IS1136/IS1341 family [Methanohalobium evestigatum Z-7303]|uniref:Putative transposase IS891/IS1136/IS1341 family n=1 Tax=Methanohalobium evestigatum (strain ATCC BAA-1072 / DSM 3721 / NBRC 107634 / OCM 161 / Z-7303) TaxID=644295 RepID=D7E6P8_METEZ|nr:helix-turn-helix domain-containing protein [Methanohalobium evestigatum]ADI73270.1 putative transposase IS891/IS1136/IS1341 family [Methanohalobium evestigatum Z-7303]
MVRKEGQNCRNLRLKIYPTPEQERKLDDTLECCRSIWNHLLSLQVDLYDRFGLSVKRSDLEKKPEKSGLSYTFFRKTGCIPAIMFCL